MLDEVYRKGLRDLLMKKGVVVAIDEDEREEFPNYPDLWISTYSWKDLRANDHLRRDSCSIIIPAGAVVTEVCYSEFQGTFSDNRETVGGQCLRGNEG